MAGTSLLERCGRSPSLVLGLGAVASGFLVARAILRLDPLASDRGALLVVLALVHLALIVPAIVALEIAARFAATRWPALVARTLAVAAVLFSAASPGGGLGPPLRVLGIAGTLAASTVLGGAVVLATRRWTLAVPGALLVVALAALGHSSALPPRPAPPPVPDIVRPTSEPAPVLVLLVDGLDPDRVEERIAAGDMPHLEDLVAASTSGRLRSRTPTLSPSLWTTIATGRPARDHGVHDFVHHRFPGVGPSVRRLPQRSGWRSTLFPRLEALSAGRLFSRVPYTSNMRRSPTVWEIAEAHGLRVGVYRWLVTWPAEPVDGFVVAGTEVAVPGPVGKQPGGGKGERWARAHAEERAEGWIWPPEPGVALPERSLEPDELGDFPRAARRDSLVRMALRDPTSRDLAERIAAVRPAVVFASFHPVDLFQHRARKLGAAGPDVVDAAHRLLDRRLGELLPAVSPETRLVLLSDHGFDFAAGHHERGPEGILVLRGPEFTAGRRLGEPAELADVAPLVLRLLGLPTDREMTGRNRVDRLVAPGVRLPAREVESWSGLRPDSVDRDRPLLPTTDRPDLELLRSVGYLD